MKDRHHKVLMIAYYFPPFGSVGWSIRVVEFAKYLPALGWDPVVLTIADDDYLLPRSGETSAAEVPRSVKVYRAWAVEPPARGFGRLQRAKEGSPAMALKSVFRKVLSFLRKYVLIPDNQILWLPFALSTGMWAIQKEGVEAVFATCPPYSMALVGTLLSYMSGRPLVFDVRDDWIAPAVLRDKPKFVQRFERWLEARVVGRASKVVLVTEQSRADFVARYPYDRTTKFECIPNGCDLEEYHAPATVVVRKVSPDDKFTLLHSGSLRGSRDPSAVVEAVRRIRSSRPEIAKELEVIFRGEVCSDYKRLLCSADLEGIVRVESFLPRHEYLEASRKADVLLVIGDRGQPNHLPGKIYEAWALGKPVLLLAEEGAATELVTSYGLGSVVLPDDAERIELELLQMFRLARTDRLKAPDPAGLARYDRKNLTVELADVLNQVIAGSSIQE